MAKKRLKKLDASPAETQVNRSGSRERAFKANGVSSDAVAAQSPGTSNRRPALPTGHTPKPSASNKLERVSTRKPSTRSFLDELKALKERSGRVIGNAYARLASVVLEGIEGLEDANAERTVRTRAQSRVAKKPLLPFK